MAEKLPRGSYWVYMPNLLPVGLLIANLSPVAVAITDQPLRQALLAIGTAFVAALMFLIFVRPPTAWAFGKLVLMAVVICLVEALSFLNAGPTADALSSLALRGVLYVYLVTGFALATCLPRQALRFPLLVEWLCLALALSASVLWLRFYSASGDSGSRFSGGEDLHPVGLGLTFGISTIVCMGIFFSSKSKLVKAVSIPAMIGMVLCVLSTGSRGTLLSLLAVLVVAVPTQVKSVKSFIGTAFALTAAIGAAVAAVVFVPAVNQQFEYVVQRFDRGMQGDMDTSQLERKMHRQYYLERIGEWAAKGDPRYDREAYPHNVFMELVIRFGFPLGGVISLALVVCVVRGLHWILLGSDSTDAVCFIVTLLGIYSFVLCQMNLALEFNRVMWLFAGYWLARPLNNDQQTYRM